MNDYLCHYGILGMKWGVRRYQNKDGTLTAEGKKRIKAENKKAFDLGRTATVYGRAVERGQKEIIKTENKIDKWYEKHPNDDGTNSPYMTKLQNKWTEQTAATISLGWKYKAALIEAQKHCNELIDEYGAENIAPISYKTVYNSRLGPHTIVNEKVTSGKEIVTSVLATAGSIGLVALGAPVGAVFTPSTASQRGKRAYNEELLSIKQRKAEETNA